MDTISNHKQLKKELDNNEFNKTLTNVQLCKEGFNRWQRLKQEDLMLKRSNVQYTVAIFFEKYLF